MNAERLFHDHGVHPNRNLRDGIYVSTGSLGHGIGIALGMALAKRSDNVYVLISDGEMAEGSVYECLNVAKDQEVKNLKIHINCNGYGAYRRVYDYRIADIMGIYSSLDITIHRTKNEFPFLEGLDAHYKVMTSDDYKLACEILS